MVLMSDTYIDITLNTTKASHNTTDFTLDGLPIKLAPCMVTALQIEHPVTDPR